MNTRHVSSPVLRLQPLVACFAMALGNHVTAGVALPSAGFTKVEGTADRPTSTFLVQNCADAGQGSLRDAVHAANVLGTDATIQFDLATMGCSTITLTTGEIDITVTNMTIGGAAPML